ncbi:hypothetical protein [Streptomyces griseorubiginosus]|uniref:hypothetical protein n=1 Tax=Streptomyces griseorubiginosus TaxID=67304 RepID=UPI0036F124E2
MDLPTRRSGVMLAVACLAVVVVVFLLAAVLLGRADHASCPDAYAPSVLAIAGILQGGLIWLVLRMLGRRRRTASADLRSP